MHVPKRVRVRAVGAEQVAKKARLGRTLEDDQRRLEPAGTQFRVQTIRRCIRVAPIRNTAADGHDAPARTRGRRRRHADWRRAADGVGVAFQCSRSNSSHAKLKPSCDEYVRKSLSAAGMSGAGNAPDRSPSRAKKLSCDGSSKKRRKKTAG